MRDPVNINCTWHWIDVHGKKKKKKIYTFIILKIEEVPPVIIKSTVESERLETLNVLSTGFQHPENTVFYFFALRSKFNSLIVDLRLPPRFGGSEGIRQVRCSGVITREEAAARSSGEETKKASPAPNTHTSHKPQSTVTHTPDVELRGLSFVYLSLL